MHPLGIVPTDARGSLPFALVHGESLVAAASWADVEAQSHEAQRSILNFFATALGSAGDPVVAIDRHAKTATSRSGRTVRYDRLLIATGSEPFIIPVSGRDLPGVVGFRDLSDVDAMLAAAERGGDAVVIGGGLLGLEAAHGLTLRGMKVTVLHLMPNLMERQLSIVGMYQSWVCGL